MIRNVSRMLVLALLMTSAVLLVAEEDTNDDDVDRTDFTPDHLKEDKPVVVGPSEEVESASLLPDILEEGKVSVGTASHLLVSLANMGSLMYNVTYIDGYLQDPATKKRLEKFARKNYGEPLAPREQRSFHYAFSPKAELKTGIEARLVFTAHYLSKREGEQYLDVVYNETIELIPKPMDTDDKMVLVAGGAVAVVLVLVFLYVAAFRSKASSAPYSSKKAGAKADGPPMPAVSEWLEGTPAANQNSRGKKVRKKA
mmetsp:Transcript_2906/g.4941  ORF Transcript_2906/g.4941 Transcript_2906/m.4941 type:complete len:256 (-) Transcript_2906:561-1328(-)|eukprot:CAMPEP_0119325464 /NCGR_PEP_ID=MMETSP1333-20130426/65860_1 /TAXON_ID=418940 /ORGANISM="Scyphosphaera apsteinii, Strain RCC1455" /LENGTH=255 /DNA_ID=CAMNT_0007333453 /DNA_START=21 /DNA_END=788 /DNA_ORIENTATION=+